MHRQSHNINVNSEKLYTQVVSMHWVSSRVHSLGMGHFIHNIVMLEQQESKIKVILTVKKVIIT